MGGEIVKALVRMLITLVEVETAFGFVALAPP